MSHLKFTFHHPYFHKNFAGKIHPNIDVTKDYHGLEIHAPRTNSWCTAITSSPRGFPSDVDGTHIFSCQLSEGNKSFLIGFTTSNVFDTQKCSGGQDAAYPGSKHMTGTALNLYTGKRTTSKENGSGSGGWTNYFPSSDVYQKEHPAPKEVSAILSISQGGKHYDIRWVIDGVEGPLVDCTADLPDNGVGIFPSISIFRENQSIRTLAADEVVHSRLVWGQEKYLKVRANMIKFFEIHAPYNLSRVDLILSKLSLMSPESYFNQLFVMYDVKEEDFRFV